MVIPRSLLFKGLAAGAAVGGVGVAIHQRKNISSLLSPSSSSKEVWGDLKCGGGNCTIESGKKILVKKEGSNSFEVTSLGEGKIKLYKVEDSTYSGGFKFSIEDNDISGTDNNNKLEEFETYEIKKGGDSESEEALKGQHYLLRKTDAKTEIKNALGLPWDLPENGSPKEQTGITTDNLKNAKFKEGTATVTGTVKLTIKKDGSKEEYPLGYKFTFTSTSGDSTLAIGGTSISLKNGSGVDFKIKKEGSSLSLEKAWSLETLASKVGLKKEASGDYWTVGDSGLNIKLDSTKKTNKTKYGNPTGRVKVYTEQAGYNEGLKFTIEKGDIDLKESENNSSTTYNLGQFQSYEIVKDDDGNWYFSRKDGDQSKIKELLGLPCDLPTTETQKDCSLTTENIKTIKFEGAGSTAPTITGNPKLTIHKESGRYDYPLGYKFVFTSTSGESTLTVGTTPTKLKDGVNVDYKIKISGTNNETLTLEKAFTADYLMGETSFNKSGDGWNLGDKNVYVKQGDKKSSSLTKTGAQTGKIKLYDGTPGYNQGMKFVVEDGEMNFDTDNSISKLSKYETYEVVKENDGYWYFSRKQTSTEAIRDILGLPSTCSMPSDSKTPTNCALDSTDKLKAIKFEGKPDDQAVTIAESGSSVTLKISKETSATDFPKNYKFTLVSEKDVTIPQTSGSSITIKKKTNTEFKIKESGNKLTLEKAWTPTSLGKKVNLKDCNAQEKKCSFGDNINVYESDSGYVDEASIDSASQSEKLVYEDGQEDYNQGFKFYLENDVTLSGGTGPDNGKVTKINKKDTNFPTYQIMEKTIGGNTKWYLVKKSS